jgi:hypothetical protein
MEERKRKDGEDLYMGRDCAGWAGGDGWEYSVGKCSNGAQVRVKGADSGMA